VLAWLAGWLGWLLLLFWWRLFVSREREGKMVKHNNELHHQHFKKHVSCGCFLFFSFLFLCCFVKFVFVLMSD